MPTFNIRVYALFINGQNEVLITDEFRFGQKMTKFPGGGLNWGEGTLECLRRECREELGCEIEVLKHFYTTDFFQPAAFYENQQLISIYYFVKNTTPFCPPLEGEITESPFTDSGQDRRAEGSQSFRWLSIANLTEEEVTFPIDKKVALMLKAQA